jgi:phage-related protein
LAIADHTVKYDAAAAQELVVAVKSKEGRRAIFNAIDKLEALGEQLAPPHMKPLGGEGAAGLRELRPRQGRSDWRPVYTRIGERAYVILAVGKHDEFEKLLARAQARARQYGVWRT